MTPLSDAFLDRLASAAVREGLADAVYTTLSTPIGPLVVVQGQHGVLRIAFEGDDERLDLPVDFSLVGGPFRRAVLETLHREVHRGEVVTYGALARQAGNPRAVRATGTACATNPIPIVVPCHRVLPASGRLGNYGGGPERKRVLLTLEGATVL
jgi:methylated-DNA-[protein]-cysteine S-methyltransferase